ncbi:MAG: DUF3040 domain-containing protein [Acidimicrobiales bacterium]
MSARDDATLSAQERAALAGLEARAESDDPRLANQLRGQKGPRPQVHLSVPPGLVAWWSRTNLLVVGPILAIAGLAGLVVGVSVSLVLGVAGAVVATAGLVMVAVAAEGRIRAARPKPPDVVE